MQYTAVLKNPWVHEPAAPVARKNIGPIHVVKSSLNRHTQLLFATGIEGGIHNRQVLKYQPYK